jgi:IclR family transcriptional regulator, acetate operon repressor
MTPRSNTLDKGLRLLEVVISHGEAAPIAVLAKRAGLPASTAHRILATLQQRGFIARAARGNYLPGPTLIRLGGMRDLQSVLKAVSRPLLEDLAKLTGMTAHLGVFEGDMVTYLVKAQGDAEVLTKEGLQLEAYCSGIGKVLLAFLPEAERERYLASGPFIPLTPNTIVDPAALRQLLDAARQNGYALDDGEIDQRVCCVAAPVWVDGQVSAAISLSASGRGPEFSPVEIGLAHLQHTARLLEAALQRPLLSIEAR